MVKISPLSSKESAHADSVWSVCFASSSSSENDLIFTGSLDETVSAWKASDSGEIEKKEDYIGHTLGAVSVAASDSGLVASSALDSMIRVWELESSETRTVIECAPSESWEIAFEPGKNSKHIAVAGGVSGTVKLFSTVANSTDSTSAHQTHNDAKFSYEVPVREEHQNRFVYSVSYSSNGKYIACGTTNGTVALFDAESGKVLGQFDGHKLPVRSVCFSPDSKCLYTASDDGFIHIYDVISKQLIDSFSGHTSWVLSIAASPDGNSLVSGSADKSVKLWDVSSRQCIQIDKSHKDAVWDVSFNTHGTRVASVSSDKSVSIFTYN